MTLTENEVRGKEAYIRRLKRTRHFLNHPPTVARLAARNVRVWAVLLFGMGVGVFLLYRSVPLMAWLVAGLAVGAILRDLSWFRATVRDWPLFALIIDREKLNRLLMDETED